MKLTYIFLLSILMFSCKLNDFRVSSLTSSVYNHINVNDLGIQSFSTIEQTDAINDIIYKYRGHTLFFPKGVYYLKPTSSIALNLCSNTHLKGEKGTIFKFYEKSNLEIRSNELEHQITTDSGSHRYWQMINAGKKYECENILIEGIEFDGCNEETRYYSNNGNKYYYNGKGWDAQQYFIFIDGINNKCKDITIRDCYLHDIMGDVINVRNASYIKILDVKFKDYLRQGVGNSNNSSNILISQCVDLGNDNIKYSGGSSYHTEPSKLQYLNNITVQDCLFRTMSCTGVNNLSISNISLLNKNYIIPLNYSAGISLINVKAEGVKGVKLRGDLLMTNCIFDSDSRMNINLNFEGSGGIVMNSNSLKTNGEISTKIIDSKNSVVYGNKILSGSTAVYFLEVEDVIISNNSMNNKYVYFRGFSKHATGKALNNTAKYKHTNSKVITD